MVQDLDKKLDDKVMQEMNAGYEKVTAGEYEVAEKHYLTAWEIFPEPKYDWDSSQITLYDISAFYLKWKKFDQALEWANLVFRTTLSPRDGSPYLTIGIIYFECDDFEKAFDYFSKTFEVSKRRGFQGSDKKYLEFYLKHKAQKKSPHQTVH